MILQQIVLYLDDLTFAGNIYISVTHENMSSEHNKDMVSVIVPSSFGMYNFY